jgi:MFS family permease
LVVAATFIATTTLFSITYSFTTFLTAMSTEFGTGNGATALLFGLTIFFLFMLSLPAGQASDRFGPRPVVLFGGTSMVLGLFLTSFVESIGWGYLSYGFGIGVGVACCYVPMVSQVSGWFERQRAVALGIAVSGIGVGTLIGPPLANHLIESVGWRETYRLAAVLALVGLSLAACLVARAPGTGAAEPVRLGVLVRKPAFRGMYLGTLFMTLALYVPIVFLAPYAQTRGIGSAAAAALMSFLGFGSLAGRLFLGMFAARLGLLRLYQSCFAVLGACFALWLFAGDRYGVLAMFALLLGIAYGGYVALTPAATAELFGAAGLGTTLGALYTGGGIGGLVGPVAAGWLIDRSESYTPAIASAMVLALLSVFVLRSAVRRH